ncbi:nuclease-related domain-containing protein [Hydrogenibacillus sp. N12]|uniref:nuclease-related domain-containing protein n=1 Tax=Hydrogenibacillus sp. N12 TaxID=2866627 RepID=UPI001C7CE021|nr:nuclease-related domain-containing protein [Hydrogenibacillus sp. N12]QZA33268.1 NERD domain-containing protein [Hydrogenibacillus sp. N12]
MAKHFRKAGVSARKMAEKRTLILYGIILIYLVVGVLLIRMFPNSTVIGAFGIGLIISVFVVLLGNEKDNPDKMIDRALQGAEGEQRVEKILSSLPDTYVVFHDLPCPAGNIDHIVVGPTGIFVIETKSHRGEITVSSDGNLLRDGRPLEKNVVSQVWRQTMWLKETLESRLGHSVFIHPFLVFVNGFVRVYRPVQGVTVLPGKWLVETITKKPSRLTEQQVSEIEQSLRAL